MLIRMEGRTEKFTPVGQLCHWGSQFDPRGEVENGTLLPCSEIKSQITELLLMVK
jgi:hypothetical protein